MGHNIQLLSHGSHIPESVTGLPGLDGPKMPNSKLHIKKFQTAFKHAKQAETLTGQWLGPQQVHVAEVISTS